MTSLELYKFIIDEGLEIDWRGEELILWVEFIVLDEFVEMIRHYLSDGGMDVNLQERCVALDIVPICEFYGIEPETIQQKEGGEGVDG